MSSAADEFSGQYREALTGYLSKGGEGFLNHAYELGRQALDSGMGILDLVSVHESAVSTALEQATNGHDSNRQIGKAGRFLVETLSPYELFHLGNRDANLALRRLNEILEEEARRIAHALHDEAAQLLATVYLEIAEISREVPEPVQPRVNRITDHLDQVRDQLRRLSHELRPPILDRLGLVPALRFLADGVQKRSGLEVEVGGDTDGRLPQPVETALYRACQEALNNVTKHAKASRAGIRVETGEQTIVCTVWDDGCGFDWPLPQEIGCDGLGLMGIKERVGAFHGKLEIAPRKDKGTRLQISVPLKQDT